MLVPKKLPKCPPRRPKNDSKTKKKTTRKKKPEKERILSRFGLPNAPPRRPKNDKKANKKTTRKKNQKKNQHKRKNLTQLWTESGALLHFLYLCFLLCVCFEHFKPNRFLLIFATVAFLLALLGCSWPLLALSWPLFGRSWPLFGRFGWSRGVRAHVRAHGGAVCECVCECVCARGVRVHAHAHVHPKIIQKSMPKMTDLDPQGLPKWPPNRSQNRPKIDAKNERKKNTI